MKKFTRILLVPATFLLLLGCNSGGQSALNSSSSTPTMTPAPEPTATPTPAPTPSPSPTPVPTPIATFGWQTGAYGACSQTCGGGTQNRAVTCNNSIGAIVSDSFCSVNPKPPTTQACNTHLCASISSVTGPQFPSSAPFARFTFSGVAEGGYECSINGSAFSSCVSPKDYSNLASTTHNFSVRARDIVGQFSAVQSRQWSVDITQPTTRFVPGYNNRSYNIYFPQQYRPGISGLVLVLHGAGQDRSSMTLLLCPGGNLSSAGCFHKMAQASNYVTVFIDGTIDQTVFTSGRTFNAGGGANGYAGIAGTAFLNSVNDVTSILGVVDEIQSLFPINSARVFSTGVSNGAAMSHRLACEASNRIKAIAAVAGANQWSAAGGACQITKSVPMLQIHGADDPIWPYGDVNAPGPLIYNGVNYGLAASVADTVLGWAARNNCSNLVIDTANPVFAWATFSDCAKSSGRETKVFRITGQGHVWPELPGFSSNSTIIDFFNSN